jgi:hypothetical protein
MSGLCRPQSTPRRTAAVFFAIAAFLVPYTLGWGLGWWKFAGASLAIILCLRLARPQTFMSDLGIRMGKADIGLAGIALLFVGVIAAFLIPGVLLHVGYVPGSSASPIWKYLATPFQVLNEEMMVRAFLITFLMRLVRRPMAVSLMVAAMVAFAHFLLYRFGPPKTALSFEALATLFLVALALNQFFFTTGNIAVPFGIHLGWNLTRFGTDWIAQTSGGSLPGGMDFNLIEGNSLVIALGAILLLLAVGANIVFGLAPKFRTAPLAK